MCHIETQLFACGLARGGKTTALRMIFDECKRAGWAPIIISCNGNFMRLEDESQSQAIMRLIYAELRLGFAEDDNSTRYVYDENALDMQLGSDVPVVLLIDELNTLACPIDAKASHLLKSLFLNKPNRFKGLYIA